LSSLKLAYTEEDQTVRLASVAGQLGWNMQALIMEMNNMTGLRLDALGLQMDAVKAKAKELEAAGMSAKDAWAEAIIQAGEARLVAVSCRHSMRNYAPRPKMAYTTLRASPMWRRSTRRSMSR
jgi:hypothetical protein